MDVWVAEPDMAQSGIKVHHTDPDCTELKNADSVVKRDIRTLNRVARENTCKTCTGEYDRNASRTSHYSTLENMDASEI